MRALQILKEILILVPFLVTAIQSVKKLWRKNEHDNTNSANRDRDSKVSK